MNIFITSQLTQRATAAATEIYGHAESLGSTPRRGWMAENEQDLHARIEANYFSAAEADLFVVVVESNTGEAGQWTETDGTSDLMFYCGVAHAARKAVLVCDVSGDPVYRDKFKRKEEPLSFVAAEIVGGVEEAKELLSKAVEMRREAH